MTPNPTTETPTPTSCVSTAIRCPKCGHHCWCMLNNHPCRECGHVEGASQLAKSVASAAPSPSVGGLPEELEAALAWLEAGEYSEAYPYKKTHYESLHEKNRAAHTKKAVTVVRARLAALSQGAGEQEPEPEIWECQQCGKQFDRETFSHGVADHHPSCYGNCRGNCPVEVECGPVNRLLPTPPPAPTGVTEEEREAIEYAHGLNQALLRNPTLGLLSDEQRIVVLARALSRLTPSGSAETGISSKDIPPEFAEVLNKDFWGIVSVTDPAPAALRLTERNIWDIRDELVAALERSGWLYKIEITGEGKASPPSTPPGEGQIKAMVDRFLGWKLPDDFNPDGGIQFNRSGAAPVGTNLLTADQAEAMFRYVLEGRQS